MKRTLTVLAIVFVASALAITGCYYDKGELIYPPSTNNSLASCDTSVARYSVEVKNILQANCYVCHGGSASAGSGYVLDTYNGVRTMALSDRLVRAITHTGPANTHMPQGGAKLPACDIAKIRTWVRNGALNN